MTTHCTSGRAIRGIVEKHNPCGRPLVCVARDGKPPVWACLRCDNAIDWPSRREAA